MKWLENWSNVIFGIFFSFPNFGGQKNVVLKKSNNQICFKLPEMLKKLVLVGWGRMNKRTKLVGWGRTYERENLVGWGRTYEQTNLEGWGGTYEGTNLEHR